MAEQKTALGLPKKATAALAYLLGWVSGLVILLIEKDDKDVRFHAMQAIILSGGLTILARLPIFDWRMMDLIFYIEIAILVVCMVKAYQGERFKIPVIGDFVEKQIK